MSRKLIVRFTVAFFAMSLPASAQIALAPGPGVESSVWYENPRFPIDAVSLVGSATVNLEKWINVNEYTDYGVRWKFGSSYQELSGLGTREVNGFVTVSYAMNDLGTVAGMSVKEDASGTFVGFPGVVWSPTTTIPQELSSLNTSGLASGQPTDINNSGMAVGESAQYPVLWQTSTNEPMMLDSLDIGSNGFPDSLPLVINDAGMMAGYSARFAENGTSLGRRPVRWNEHGSITELGNLGVSSAGKTIGYTHSMNEAGVVVGGVSRVVNGNLRGGLPVKWNPTSNDAIELENLGLSIQGLALVEPRKINNSDVIIGTIDKFEDGIFRGPKAVRWDALGAITELPSFATSPDARSFGYDINDLNIAVGTTASDSAANVAVAWMPSGEILDLNSLLSDQERLRWTLRVANDITDTGWVAGVGKYDRDGNPNTSASYDRAFVMLVPQLGTYGMGDANFDTRIDFADLLLIAQNYGLSNEPISTEVGDLDLDGIVDFSDLLITAQHYGGGASTHQFHLLNADFVTDWNRAVLSVPEPTIIALPTIVLVALGYRRRGTEQRMTPCTS